MDTPPPHGGCPPPDVGILRVQAPAAWPLSALLRGCCPGQAQLLSTALGICALLPLPSGNSLGASRVRPQGSAPSPSQSSGCSGVGAGNGTRGTWSRGLTLPVCPSDPPAACLPQPQAMTQSDYLASCLPLGALVLLCLGQVYAYRLRRIIAAFYFPKVRPLPPTAPSPAPETPPLTPPPAPRAPH